MESFSSVFEAMLANTLGIHATDRVVRDRALALLPRKDARAAAARFEVAHMDPIEAAAQAEAAEAFREIDAFERRIDADAAETADSAPAAPAAEGSRAAGSGTAMGRRRALPPAGLSWSADAPQLQTLLVREKDVATDESPWSERARLRGFFRDLKFPNLRIQSLDSGLAKMTVLEDLNISGNEVGTIENLPASLVGLHAYANDATRWAQGVPMPRCLFLGLGYNSLAAVPGLAVLAPAVRILDLAHNDLEDLDAMLEVVRDLPSLQHLLLAGNPLALTQNYRAHFVAAASRELKSLDDLVIPSGFRRKAVVLLSRASDHRAPRDTAPLTSAVGFDLPDGADASITRSPRDATGIDAEADRDETDPSPHALLRLAAADVLGIPAPADVPGYTPPAPVALAVAETGKGGGAAAAAKGKPPAKDDKKPAAAAASSAASSASASGGAKKAGASARGGTSPRLPEADAAPPVPAGPPPLAYSVRFSMGKLGSWTTPPVAPPPAAAEAGAEATGSAPSTGASRNASSVRVPLRVSADVRLPVSVALRNRLEGAGVAVELLEVRTEPSAPSSGSSGSEGTHTEGATPTYTSTETVLASGSIPAAALLTPTDRSTAVVGPQRVKLACRELPREVLEAVRSAATEATARALAPPPPVTAPAETPAAPAKGGKAPVKGAAAPAPVEAPVLPTVVFEESPEAQARFRRLRADVCERATVWLECSVTLALLGDLPSASPPPEPAPGSAAVGLGSVASVAAPEEKRGSSRKP